jgi:hypothetical protein
LRLYQKEPSPAKVKKPTRAARQIQKAVTPECFYRGSSPVKNLFWIPAKSVRE